MLRRGFYPRLHPSPPSYPFDYNQDEHGSHEQGMAPDTDVELGLHKSAFAHRWSSALANASSSMRLVRLGGLESTIVA